MDITLPKRIDGQQPVSLNGRQQITVVGANGSGKTRFVNRMIADLGNRAFTISALKALYPIKDGDIQAQSVTTFYQQALQSVQFVKPVAETEFEMLLFMLLNDEMNDMFTYKMNRIGAAADIPLPRTKIDTVVKLWKEVFPKNDVQRSGGKIKFTNRLGDNAFNPRQLSAGEKAVFFLALSALLEFSLSRTARWAGILLLLVGALHGGTLKGRLQRSSLIRSYLHHLANSSSVHLT